MNRNQLLQTLKSSISRIAQATKDSLEALKLKVNSKSQIAINGQPQSRQELVKGAMFKLKQFYQQLTEKINQRTQLTLQNCLICIRGITQLANPQNNIGTKENYVPVQGMGNSDPLQGAALTTQQIIQPNLEIRSSSVINNVSQSAIEHHRQPQMKQEIIKQPPALPEVSSVQDNHKPSQRLSKFLSNILTKITESQSKVASIFQINMPIQDEKNKQHLEPSDGQKQHSKPCGAEIVENNNIGKQGSIQDDPNKFIRQTDNTILNNQNPSATNNFSTQLQNISHPQIETHIVHEDQADNHLKPSISESLTMPTGIRESRHEPVKVQTRVRRIKGKGLTQHTGDHLMEEEDDEDLVEYVYEQRTFKHRHHVGQLNRQHIPTNYDASDEQSNGHDQLPKYINPLYKHKTEVSVNAGSKIFEPRIYVNEAPTKQITQEQWPITEPKKKRKIKDSIKKVDMIQLKQSPNSKTKKHKALQISTERDLAHYAEKILRLREARQKKMELESKLDVINKQISEIRNPQKSIEKSKSPKTKKNSMKDMITISDDKEARNKALSLVRKLKIQRERREKSVINIFSKVSKEMVESIAQLSRLRSEQQKKSKEKNRLQILQRMKEQQRRKFDEYRLQSDNMEFLQAVKNYEHKTKPAQSRKSMAWIQANDTPELASRKQMLERLRNLSYVQKRSLVEQYNKELMRK